MRAKTMTLTLVATLAAMMTVSGCSHRNDTGRCVDGNGNILPNSACQGTGGGYAGGGGGYGYPHRVYGGSVSGGRVTGYSSSPSDGGDGDDGGISRGGFGGHGGGDGGGE